MCLLALALGSQARGATITQTFDVPTQVLAGPISDGGQNAFPAFSLLLPFDQFDKGLGTLDPVRWA